MKKLCLFLVFLLLPCLAFSENTFPACQGTVTDLAAVMDQDTAKDLNTLSQRYEKITDGKLYVITRHFLGGKEANTYAETLFDEWQLGKNDVLLLMVIGEESAALALGQEARKALPEELVITLFSTHFKDPFMNRKYAEAAGELMCQAVSTLVSARGKTLSCTGLFGHEQEENPAPSFAEEIGALFSSWLEEEEEENSSEKEIPIVKEAREKGFSLWKTLLVIWLFYVIFFRKKKKKKKNRRYNFGHSPHRH